MIPSTSAVGATRGFSPEDRDVPSGRTRRSSADKITSLQVMHALGEGNPFYTYCTVEINCCSLDYSGTKWLISEHKKCISELEHLKNMITDMHRWVDLIHERGQAMYHAFTELRKHLASIRTTGVGQKSRHIRTFCTQEDIQRQIRELHRSNHDNRDLVDRLSRELDEWKEKCRRMQVQLEDLKSKYVKVEKEHMQMKKEFEDCERGNLVRSKSVKPLCV